MQAPNITVECGTIAQLQNRAVAVIKVTGARTKLPQSYHTMLILDCSGSMSEAIDDVRRDSCAYISEMGEKNFASVIIFSGHGRARLIAGPTQTNKDGREMVIKAIEDEVKILDVTVFSEPLELVLKTAKKLAGKDTRHSAVLFTDGCAVPTKWTFQKEQAKSFEVAQQLRAEEVAVSVVGYGPHYDIDFLTCLMQHAGSTGIFRHVSEIEDYRAAVNSIQEVNQKTIPVAVELSVKPQKGSAGTVYRVTPEVAQAGQNGKASTIGMYEGEVTFYVELSEATTTLELTGKIGDQKIDINVPAGTLSDDNKTNFVRVLGAYAFLNGQRDTAAELLDLAGDTAASDKFGSAFTERERREAVDETRRYFVGRTFIGKGLKRQDKRFCVLDVVRELIERDGNVVYLGEYKRTGELTVDKDDRIIHGPTRNLQLLALKSHESRLNFSFTALKDVKVRPEDGKGQPKDMKIWRNYNVILDGNLHIPLLKASLSKESFELLQQAGVLKADETYSQSKLYSIDLRGTSVISRNWAQPATMGLVPLMQEEAYLEAKQTALNARRKETKPTGFVSAEEDNIYNFSSKKAEGVEKEYYAANCFEWRLMGFKPVDDFSKQVEKMTFQEADTAVKAVRKRLASVRFIMRAIVFATETVNPDKLKWGAAKETKRGKNPKQEQTTTFDGATLKRVTWQEQIACS